MSKTGRRDESPPEKHIAVHRLVARLLKKDPTVSDEIVQQRAAELDHEIGSLTAPQFHGRFMASPRRKLKATNGHTRDKKRKAAAKVAKHATRESHDASGPP